MSNDNEEYSVTNEVKLKKPRGRPRLSNLKIPSRDEVHKKESARVFSVESVQGDLDTSDIKSKPNNEYVKTMHNLNGEITSYYYSLPNHVRFHTKFADVIEYLKEIVMDSKEEFLKKAIVNEVRRRKIRAKYEKIAVIEALKEEIQKEMIRDFEESNEIWLPRNKKTDNDVAREKFIMKLREIDERKMRIAKKKIAEEKRLKDITMVDEKNAIDNPESLEPIIPGPEFQEEQDSIIQEAMEINKDVDGVPENSEEDVKAAPSIEDLYK
jgi:hypothetical protein